MAACIIVGSHFFTKKPLHKGEAMMGSIRKHQLSYTN